MIGHNIYINLDLSQQMGFKSKLKVHVGQGNNCNMIKGLMKRRFWWNIVDQYSEDCQLVWTQLRIQKIFMNQESAEDNVLQPI